MLRIFFFKEGNYRDWRDVTAVKRIFYSSARPEFGSWHAH